MMPYWIKCSQQALLYILMLGTALTLAACVEINGQADVDAKGRVKVVTTYDFSKVFNNIKGQNPTLSDRMEGFDCKIFVSDSKNFKCEDEGALKYKMSDEVDRPVGVTVDDKTGDLTFDTVKFFANVTDIKRMVQRNGQEADLISTAVAPLLPLQSARRQTYINEGMSIVLKVKFANDIASIDGRPVQNAGKEITINFMDIADKQSYIITTHPDKTSGGTWAFVIGVLILLALAIWFLRNKNKGQNTPPAAPKSPKGPENPSAAGAHGAENKAGNVSKAQNFAQTIATAAVGVGASAVGGGAQHTVEEVESKEKPSAPVATPEPSTTPEAEADSASTSEAEKEPEQPSAS